MSASCLSMNCVWTQCPQRIHLTCYFTDQHCPPVAKSRSWVLQENQRERGEKKKAATSKNSLCPATAPVCRLYIKKSECVRERGTTGRCLLSLGQWLIKGNNNLRLMLSFPSPYSSTCLVCESKWWRVHVRLRGRLAQLWLEIILFQTGLVKTMCISAMVSVCLNWACDVWTSASYCTFTILKSHT